MRLAINLDREATLQAGEVNYVAAARKLPSKPRAPWTLPQLLPKEHLRQCKLPPKPPRETYILVRRADGAMLHALSDPSTMLRMVPLPVPGRI
jgi:hypothetical protein